MYNKSMTVGDSAEIIGWARAKQRSVMSRL